MMASFSRSLLAFLAILLWSGPAHEPWVVSAESSATCTIDADQDGFFDCDDCDDTDPAIYPGAPQICDGRNNDCNSFAWPSLRFTNDGDDDFDGFSECGGDCDDDYANTYPGAPQLCDGLNNNCDAWDWPTISSHEIDGDLDGWIRCRECLDTEPAVYPGAPQICGDGLNNDCNHPSWPSLSGTNEVDDDGDGLTGCAGDCDDVHGSVFPGAPQICDGLNNDCDDAGWPVPPEDEMDRDRDGFGLCAGDCDDLRATIHPGAPQICDGRNNDCDDPTWPTVPPDEPLVCAFHIPARCPQHPDLDGPGVLCEDFDTDRNTSGTFDFTRLPPGVDPEDPLRAIGDATDDVLGYTIDTGAIPTGTGAVTCAADAGFTNCQAPVAAENDWHLHSPNEGPGAGYADQSPLSIGAPDGGKAHRGLRSLHMGRHVSPSTTLGDVIRFRQVSAFVIDSQGDPNVPGLIPGPYTTLAFWHMISIPDDENFGFGYIGNDASFGGGQVQISLLDTEGRFEKWRPLKARVNGYDSVDQRSVSICGFDPTDDQSPPADESFCGLASNVWADLGDIYGTDATCETDTDNNDPAHKDCGDISGCSGGPLCTETGSIGSGVWARSEFDLSPFAGRVARLRWIGMVEGGWSFGSSRSSMEPTFPPSENQLFEGDAGWWIDDIVLTDLRVAPGSCQDDLDGDGVANCADCNASDPTAWMAPGEITDLTFASDGRTLTWSPPNTSGGTVLAYDTIKLVKALPSVIASSGPFGDLRQECLEADDSTDTQAVDPFSPRQSGVFYYLVRADNGCPFETVPLGFASDGLPRPGRGCP